MNLAGGNQPANLDTRVNCPNFTDRTFQLFATKSGINSWAGLKIYSLTFQHTLFVGQCILVEAP